MLVFSKISILWNENNQIRRFILYCIYPVSYTHLDVYKRQAPELVHWLLKLGVKFNMSGYDDVDLRNFGGQKKKRTAFAQSDTGKQIMTAMIDAVRRKEASGMVERFSHHSFLTLRLCGNICCGCVIRDEYLSLIHI